MEDIIEDGPSSSAVSSMCVSPEMNVGPDVNSFLRRSPNSRSMFDRRPSEKSRPNRRTAMEREKKEVDKKRQSLDRRETAIKEATSEAVMQVENMIRLTQCVHDYEVQNKELNQLILDLQSKNDELVCDVSTKDCEISELREINTELLEEVMQYRQNAAMYKQEADKAKVEKLVFSSTPGSSSDRLQKKYDTAIAEVKGLKLQLNACNRQCQELLNENKHLNSVIDELQSQPSHVNLVDERDKETLLQVIRKSIEDKMRWELYCQRLLRRIISREPAILDIVETPDPPPTKCCKWERFSMTLLSQVMSRAPHILEIINDATLNVTGGHDT